MPDLTGALMRRAADQTDDARDHDELHAAAEVLDGDPVWAYTNQYVKRWIDGLVETHGIEAEW
jgi:hypothetical protein